MGLFGQLMERVFLAEATDPEMGSELHGVWPRLPYKVNVAAISYTDGFSKEAFSSAFFLNRLDVTAARLSSGPRWAL